MKSMEVDALYLLLTKIYDIYQSDNMELDEGKSLEQEKWFKIANNISENNHLIKDIYQQLIKINKNIKLDWSIKLDDRMSMIKQENNVAVKLSNIAGAFHSIVYSLMTHPDNYYFSLDGKQEMSVLDRPIIYYINMSIKNEQNIYFHAFLLIFALESVFDHHLYVGIDFEFSSGRIIKLTQLSFEHNVDLSSIIEIISPPELEPNVLEDFVDMIICNPYIKKILHGSDSLDLPYLYNQLLAGDTDKIIAFTKKFIDTRFLCEYYKLNHGDSGDYKCSIYDQDPTRSAIYYFGLVTKAEQDKLSQVLDTMPADINWNIHKMPKSQVLYAQYDVLFLKYFYYRIIRVAVDNAIIDVPIANQAPIIKDVCDLYKNVLPQLTQFIYLENKDITGLRAKCKTEVDVANNYFIKKPDGLIKLVDIFNGMTGLSSVKPKVEIDKIIKVNHFKSTIQILIKRMVYGHISKYCVVYKDKNNLWQDKLNNQIILDFFDFNGFTKLFQIFTEINQQIETRIKTICKRN